jgi:hypothetical protein
MPVGGGAASRSHLAQLHQQQHRDVQREASRGSPVVRWGSAAVAAQSLTVEGHFAKFVHTFLQYYSTNTHKQNKQAMATASVKRC